MQNQIVGQFSLLRVVPQGSAAGANSRGAIYEDVQNDEEEEADDRRDDSQQICRPDHASTLVWQDPQIFKDRAGFPPHRPWATAAE